MDRTSNSRKLQARSERASKEGRHNQDKVWAVSWRNKVWFSRSDHDVRRLSKKGNQNLDVLWAFQVPDIPVTYDPIIDGRTSETNKAKREAYWEVPREVHEVYLRVEDSMKQLVITAYNAYWLEEIEDDVLDFTHKTGKEMLAHLLT